MHEFLAALLLAVGWGAWTAVNPCPLATNIAAISYVGRRPGSPRRLLLAGLLYALGQAAAYAALAAALAWGLLSAQRASLALQFYVHKSVGPLLILVALFLLEWIRLDLPSLGAHPRVQRLVDAWGLWSAAPLGVLFAWSFCPVSAANFFFVLIPLSVRTGSLVLIPCAYGIGVAAPVLVFAALAACGAGMLGGAFERVVRIERLARRAAGVILLAVGLYCTFWKG